MLPRLPLLACLAVFVFFAPAQAGDWPEFRGPTGQGHSAETGLPLEWGPDSGVAWKVAVPGKGWSSPVIVAGRIYLTSAVEGEKRDDPVSLRALCFDAATGKLVWNREVFRQEKSSPRIHTKNSHASPTPLVADGRLYVHFGHLGTACLDLDGNVKWHSQELTYAPVHGNGGTPILVDDRLVFSCDGSDERFVAALHRDTGKVLWKTARSVDASRGFSFSTPLSITVAGKKQVISPGSDMVGAYDPETGKELWRVRYQGYSVIPRPVFAHGLVYVCTGFNTPNLLAIRPDGTGDVTDSHVAWRTATSVPHTPSLLIRGDELFMVSDRGIASCLDARTGKTQWQERLGGPASASPLLAEDRIYFLLENGDAVVVAAGTSYKQLARNRMQERSLASFATADGALFLRTEGHLYRLAAR